MDDTLKQQLDQLLAKAEKSSERKVVEFFERVAAIELPAQEDRYWLLDQFDTVVTSFRESGIDKKTSNVLIMTALFTMGRVWERYYTGREKK